MSKRLLCVILIDLFGFLIISGLIAGMAFGFMGLGGERFYSDPVVLATPSLTETPAPTTTPTSTDIVIPDASDALIETSVPTDTPEPTATPYGIWGDSLEGYFTDGEIVYTDTRYQSKDIDITLTEYNVDKVRYWVADVYLQDIACLKTNYVTSGSQVQKTDVFARNVNAILAVNGDYITNSKDGWIIRNGIELRNKGNYIADLCVLYFDGTMETFDYRYDTIDVNALYEKYPYQVWQFGPELLNDDGTAKTDFPPNDIRPANPRTVLGYYEPGHYAFITVEGTRTGGKSLGLSLTELSKLCESLGLKAAYNMDGGGSTTLVFHDTVYAHNGRATSDIIYIAELPTE